MEKYRASDSEQERIGNLMSLVPGRGATALDVGARDGYLSTRLTRFFTNVTALDIVMPQINCEGVECVQGDLCCLQFPDNSFDFILCAEVLEHIPTALLPAACSELARVARGDVLVGVPYKQDLRIGSTTCVSCGKINPPWGHVNTFDELSLQLLFPSLRIERLSFVGENCKKTNKISAALLNYSGNPYGTYRQKETCIHCNKKLSRPTENHLLQKAATTLALGINKIQSHVTRSHPNWIHVLLKV